MDWKAIREEFISSGETVSEFAASHPGISLSTLKKKCAAGKWIEERNRFGTEKAKKVRQKNMDAAVRRETTVYNLWDKLARMTERSMNQIEGHATPSTLEHYANAIEKLQKGLGVRDQLDIDEQKARIAKLRKDADSGEKIDESKYGVVIMPDIGDINGA